MAKRKFNSGKRNFNARKRTPKRFGRKSSYTQVEKTAFLMGQVQRGLKNPDSRISASYSRGIAEPQPLKKKTLF